MNYLDIPDLMLYWDSFKNEWGDRADKVAVIKYESYGGSFRHQVYYKETRGMCIRPWQGITVLSDGKVVPCNLDFNGTVSFGNAFSQNVMDIWTGEKAEMFRELHTDGKYDLLPGICQRCETWKKA
jgi:radical SAM protein with 4Fe4S-binding SPASM domain